MTDHSSSLKARTEAAVDSVLTAYDAAPKAQRRVPILHPAIAIAYYEATEGAREAFDDHEQVKTVKNKRSPADVRAKMDKLAQPVNAPPVSSREAFLQAFSARQAQIAEHMEAATKRREMLTRDKAEKLAAARATIAARNAASAASAAAVGGVTTNGPHGTPRLPPTSAAAAALVAGRTSASSASPQPRPHPQVSAATLSRLVVGGQPLPPSHELARQTGFIITSSGEVSRILPPPDSDSAPAADPAEAAADPNTASADADTGETAAHDARDEATVSPNGRLSKLDRSALHTALAAAYSRLSVAAAVDTRLAGGGGKSASLPPLGGTVGLGTRLGGAIGREGGAAAGAPSLRRPSAAAPPDNRPTFAVNQRPILEPVRAPGFHRRRRVGN